MDGTVELFFDAPSEDAAAALAARLQRETHLVPSGAVLVDPGDGDEPYWSLVAYTGAAEYYGGDTDYGARAEECGCLFTGSGMALTPPGEDEG